MIDIESIKSQLASDDIIELMQSLDADFNYAGQDSIHFRSICHNSDSYKLYWYEDGGDGGRFYCHRDNQSWDIFGLIQHIRHCNFMDAVAYVCSTLGTQADELTQDDSLDPWQRDLRRWLPNVERDEPVELTAYDPVILAAFDRLYPTDWLEYGITRDSMDKFGIGWYARQACISIPVVQNGQLVGVRGRYTRQQDIAKGKYRPIAMLDGNVLKFSTAGALYGYDQNKAAIAKSKQVLLFESEKSVLKAPSYGIDNALAVFGSNISKRHIEMLLELGVDDVVLAFDSDYKQVGDDDFKFFVAKMRKLAGKLRPYFSTSIVYNNQGYDGYKFSPMDFTREQFDKLYERRAKL